MEKKTELITNKDGSIFHLNLLPGDISDKIIIVGDPGRVEMLASLMHEVRVRKENREFKTVTGYFENTEITVIDENSLSVDGEVFEFSDTDVEWPDMYKQSGGVFFEAHRESGELYLTVRRFTEGIFIDSIMKKEEWDTGEYHDIEG